MSIAEYRLKDFINTELKVFSNLDNVRSIPSVIDGLKDSQRKAIFGMFKHGPSEIKISQAGAAAAMVTNYAHGESSMCETMVSLAQTFPGSNNVNLLDPIGQFGSILSNQSAAHRYIFTKQSSNLRKFIKREDDLILNYRVEEGVKLEPINYYPIMPMWILNGSVGIGTGHSVRILARDPVKVAQLTQKILTGVNVQQKTIDVAMTPYFKGWKGKVVKGDSDTQWELIGTVEVVSTTKLLITELPVTYEVDKYKSILIDLMDKGIVKDYDNNSSEDGFHFEVTVPREVGKKTQEELIKLFKLSVKVGENVTMWNTEGNLQRFDNVYHALTDFVSYRIGIYKTRKKRQLEVINEELDFVENKIKFIEYWNTKMKDPHKKKKADLCAELSKDVKEEYLDRLLSMQINSLTMELVDELKRTHEKLLEEFKRLLSTSEEDLYLNDLCAI